MKNLSIGSYFTWQIAANEAAASNYQFIEKEHIFIGILSLKKVLVLKPEKIGLTLRDRQALKKESNYIENLLHKHGIETTQLRRYLRKKLGDGSYERKEKVVHRSETCKGVFKRTEELAISSQEISSLHLFAAIMEDTDGIIWQSFKEMGAEPAALQRRVLASISDWQKGKSKQAEFIVGEHEEILTKNHYLDLYGRDLTLEAREGKVGPFVGRRKELLQVIQTLARHSKNNPVLVGEAGVGKTAIVEALALRVIEGKDPEVLAGKKIVEINISTLIAGTKYRGEFEERLSHIIDEASANPEVIIFLDELHNVVGAGRAEGSMDAANLMKPALARGDLRCIGATTIGEYRRYIEADSALERRFEKIIVNEPSEDESLKMLEGLRPELEKYHQVRITDKAINAAVELSVRFDTDHRLPDKAIDLVDKAAARTRIPALSGWMGGKKVLQFGSPKGSDDQKEVTDVIVAKVLSEKLSLPIDLITGCIEGMKPSRILELENFLKMRIIGQDEAIDIVNKRLLMNHAGISKKRGPLAVFLFVGPTGVGKTEVARCLTEFLFGSALHLIRFDMSEFIEEHSIAKLIGSPPGYVGHEEEGQLTGQLRTKPYSVVLFDEVEKANPRVFDLFLQLFDEGRLTDSKGRTADAKNAIFIMTSNIAVKKHRKTIGFGDHDAADLRSIAHAEAKKYFRTEFINRIDEIAIFKPLNEENVRQILRPILVEICQSIQINYNITVKVGEGVEEYLVEAGYNTEYGVRELRRVVERLVQMPLSNLVLSGEFRKYPSWQIICDKEGISVNPLLKA